MTTHRRPSPHRAETTAAATLFALAFLAAHLTLVAAGVSPILDGDLVDTDGYTRAHRVERLMETGAWFDGTEPRSNAPFGETSHWTRPMDVLLVAASAPLTPFLGIRGAVFVAAVIVSPLLGLIVCLGAAWAVRPLVGARVTLLVPFLVLVQPMIASYSMAGRADHHALILALFVISLGFLVRAAGTDGEPRGAVGAGVAAGLGLWTSTEFLAPLALMFAGLALAWILRGGGRGERARAGVRFSAALLATALGATLLERGPGDLLAVEYDRLSAPHAFMALVATSFWIAARRLGGRLTSRRARIGFSVLGAGAAMGAMAAVFPDFFGGPWVHVDAATAEIWLRHVRELRPLLPGGGGDPGSAILYLGPVVAALPWNLVRARADRETGRLPAWLLLAMGLVAFTALALFQTRWGTYAEVLAAIGLTGAAVQILRALGSVGSMPLRVCARAAVATAALVGFPLVGGLLMDSEEPGPLPADAGCALRPALASLAREDQPRTILAFMDFGPEILYRSPHRVVATPYHRNPGIVDSHRILAGMPAEDARDAMEQRGVDLVLLCPERDRGFFEHALDGAPESALYPSLVGNEPPDWLRPIAMPESTGFLAFELPEIPLT